MIDFVKSVKECEEYAEAFQKESIDGSVFILLTDSQLQSQLGFRLGPALKLRAALQLALATVFFAGTANIVMTNQNFLFDNT